jgi:hypothetical protein
MSTGGALNPDSPDEKHWSLIGHEDNDHDWGGKNRGQGKNRGRIGVRNLFSPFSAPLAPFRAVTLPYGS